MGWELESPYIREDADLAMNGGGNGVENGSDKRFMFRNLKSENIKIIASLKSSFSFHFHHQSLRFL